MAGAEQRLAVLLAHLAPAQQANAAQPGSRAQGSESAIVVSNNGPLVIVGGICLDIQAKPTQVEVNRGTSVPGTVRQVPGGVGRNMAEALSRLLPAAAPAPVFISLVGDDTAGAFLTASLRRLRLDLTHMLTCQGAPTPCVSAVMDRGGEVAACVADVVAVETHLTPERLAESVDQIKQACLVLAEANLSAAALEYVCRTAAAARVPVFLEPVSVPKATRLARSLPYATFVSPNAGELLSMADEVRRQAGLPLLPRPQLPDDSPAASTPATGASGGSSSSSSIDVGSGSGAASRGDASGADAGRDPDPVVELLRQLTAFAEVVLLQGTLGVVLTLGSLGAALITLAGTDDAAAGRSGSARALEPLDACSSPGSGGSTTHSSSCGGGGVSARPCSGGGDGLVAQDATAAAAGAAHAPCRLKAAAPAQPGPRCLSRALTSSSLGLTAFAPAAAGGGGGGGGGGGVAQQGPSSSYRLDVLHLRALPAEVISCNGAGDTLVAGMVAALLQRQSPQQALAFGMAAAKRAVQSVSNVPELSAADWAPMRADAEAVAATARRYSFPAVVGTTAGAAAAAAAAPSQPLAQ
ncbi:hypothetical protein HYH02_004679 [Chlamydomonas schloesseri]|uniref:Carbohydrate kinase PfkB domain-containing protein n=1 Tax=Chlamydomonas schloesseri TaxID=2026947 RepID=A0A836B8U4_9CHLO|nr:hypothetical protein HYH02_004679 [Chlamydomonas schloesseri]|eukprot:KAG2450845.1 hypothetical protein HYH02_004679 [Chlamydomonas schloesseri]